MTSLYLFGGMVIFWSILLTIIFRLEKRMVWPYGELESEPAFGDAMGYGARTLENATGSGFTLLGWARDLKGKKYRVNYAMLAAPEEDVFAVVGSGSVMQIPVNATWLYTRSSDGRCFYPADHQSAIQSDPSGHWKNQLVPGASFDRLLQQHRAWIQDNRVMPLPFSRQHEREEFRDLCMNHYRFMERAGLVEFTDASLEYFHFTLFGAFQTATRGYFLGMARKLSLGRFPRSA
jgi:hypothetical protein